MRILVVDDKPDVLRRLTQLLQINGYLVDTAANGLDASEKAQSTPFDLYIIDHLMPVMDGPTLVKNLHNKQNAGSAPVILMTTQSLSTVQCLAEFPLFAGVLVKPIDEKSLYAAVDQFLPKNSLRHAL
jgi:CheY-like chemotaxis protein